MSPGVVPVACTELIRRDRPEVTLDLADIVFVTDPDSVVIVGGLGFDTSGGVPADIANLLNSMTRSRKGCSAVGRRRTSTSPGRSAVGIRSPEDQRAAHTAGDLKRGRTVQVRMVPERAGRMVLGDVVFVLEAGARLDAQEPVIAVAGGADPQAMGMKIGAVEAVRDVDVVGMVLAARIVNGEIVGQPDPQRITGARDNRRSKETRRIGAFAEVGAEVNAVAPIRVRIPQRAR